MTYPSTPQNPASENAQAGEVTGGNRGPLSGRNDDQSRAIGQDDPVAEGSRQGRERYKAGLDKHLPADADKSV